MDNHTQEQRHINMQRIRSTDTEIELVLRKALWKKGYRYRKNYTGLPGKPDIALTKYKLAIFCDGEFFHGKDWNIRKEKTLAGNNSEYWITKIERNMERDREVDNALRAMGWTVIRFWGKDVLNNTSECIRTVQEAIEANILIGCYENSKCWSL